jgi:hypothetical protein
MNEAFKEFCTKEGINPEGDYAREHWITFRAGMLAAADVLKQQFYKTQDECEQAIREVAK